MAVDEQRRHDLYLALGEAVGREAAATMMEYLPPVGWADVARRSDIEHLAAMTRSELATATAQLRAEAANTTGELRQEIAQLGTDLRREIAGTARQIAGLEAAIAGVRIEVARSGRQTLMWIVGLFTAFYATLLAAILTTR